MSFVRHNKCCRLSAQSYKLQFPDNSDNIFDWFCQCVICSFDLLQNNRGAAFIAVDFLAVFVILWLCIHFAGSMPEQAVHHCSSSIEPGTNTDIAGFIQYSFDNMACHTGNSKYLSFISIEQDNFVIVALNRLLSANVIGNTLWPVILFGSLIISVLPFIWIFIRCVHCLFLIIKGKEANK